MPLLPQNGSSPPTWVAAVPPLASPAFHPTIPALVASAVTPPPSPLWRTGRYGSAKRSTTQTVVLVGGLALTGFILLSTLFTSPSLAPREECDALRAPGRLLLNLTSPLETHWRPFDEAACPPLPGYLPALWSLLYGSETPLPGQYPITETEAYRNMIADPAPPPSLPSLPGAPPPPDPVAFLRRARLAATPPTILILGDSVDRNALVHFCRKDPVLIARNPSWEQGESGAGGFGRRGQACQQDSRRIQRRAQELKSILAELFEQDVSISHYANISSHPPDTEHDRDLTFHGHGPAHEGWDQRGLPHRCEIPFAGAKGGKREVALRVVNAFHYGMDAMDEFNTPDRTDWHKPGKFEDRVEQLFVPLIEQMGGPNSVDVILLHSGMWDLTLLGIHDHKTSHSLDLPLKPEQLAWWHDRMQDSINSLRLAFPKARIVLRKIHRTDHVILGTQFITNMYVSSLLPPPPANLPPLKGAHTNSSTSKKT